MQQIIHRIKYAYEIGCHAKPKPYSKRDTCNSRKIKTMQDYVNYNYEKSEGLVPRCFRTEVHVREYLDRNRSTGPNE